MQYLGNVHGYHTSLSSNEAVATANQLLLDAADIGSELFTIGKDADKKSEFTKEGGRLHNWLKHFNKAHMKTSGPFLMGDNVVPADFMLLSVFECLDFAIGASVYEKILPREISTWLVEMRKRKSYEDFKATNPSPILFPSMKA